MTGPLARCRVLELSHAAGAVAGRVLADLGAEVIKVEPPDGEPSRLIEPVAQLAGGERLSFFWLAFNVSKRSIAIDMERQSGQAEFGALARTADIVITDFQRLDVEHNDALAAAARRANPGLVWTEIWPYGRGKPHEEYPAGDLVLQAMGGHLYLNGDVDRPPVRIGVPVALCQGGVEAASAALMAYYHRIRRGGEGQRVDISIQECVTWTLLNTSMTAQLLGFDEVRGGAVRRERANKYYTRLVWQCRDGFIHFTPVGGGGGAAREKSYAALVAWMAEEGTRDPLLTQRDWNGADANSIRQEDYDAVAEIIGRFLIKKPLEELISRAVRDRILLAPVSSIPQVLSNPHLRARGAYERLNDPSRGSAFEYPVDWARLSCTRLDALRPAPRVDADGAELRGELVRLESAAT
jgi:crotonobetainyl-CoA:carnitine CoA-transferase CaiB-like acyl-CoA transferase